MSDQSAIVKVQTVNWMKVMKATNTDHTLYLVGRVENFPHTLLVADSETKEQIFFCEKHNFAYRNRDRCADCVTQALDVENEASVTACDTPKNRAN